MNYKIKAFFNNWSISDKINSIGIFFAFLFSIISLCKSCIQENNIEKFDYKINSLNYQPKIVIVNDPEIEQMWFDSSLIKLNIFGLSKILSFNSFSNFNDTFLTSRYRTFDYTK